MTTDAATMEPAPVVLTRAEIARLEAEARAVLREVEPGHAANERSVTRRERECGYVLHAITGTGRARESCAIERERDWRPRATRTPSGWAIEGGWLEEPVPALPTRGRDASTGGVRAIIGTSAGDDDARASLRDRYGNIECMRPSWLVSDALASAFSALLVSPRDSWEAVPLSAERLSGLIAWQRTRRLARRTSSAVVGGASRGWCQGLGADSDDAAPGHPASWRAMQRAHDAVIAATDREWATERAAIVAARGER